MKVFILACLMALALAREKEEVIISSETSESISNSQESITDINKKLEKIKQVEQIEAEIQDKINSFVNSQFPVHPFANPIPYTESQNIVPAAQPPMAPPALPVFHSKLVEILKAKAVANAPKNKEMFSPKSQTVTPPTPNLTDLKNHLSQPQLQALLQQVPQSIPQVQALLQQVPQSIPQVQALLQQVPQSIPHVQALLQQVPQSIPQVQALLQQVLQSIPQVQALLQQDVQSFPQVQALLQQDVQSIPQVQALLQQDVQSFPQVQALLQQDPQSFLQLQSLLQQNPQPFLQLQSLLQQAPQSFVQTHLPSLQLQEQPPQPEVLSLLQQVASIAQGDMPVLDALAYQYLLFALTNQFPGTQLLDSFSNQVIV